jgi:hypothetical protein
MQATEVVEYFYASSGRFLLLHDLLPALQELNIACCALIVVLCQQLHRLAKSGYGFLGSALNRSRGQYTITLQWLQITPKL